MTCALIRPTWPAPGHVHAFTTTRPHWGMQRDNEPHSTNALIQLGHLPSAPKWLRQTHGIGVLNAALISEGTEGDASVTREKNSVLAILTADCLPILITDRYGQQVAAIHAGWRGLANGIIQSTLKHFHFCAPQDLQVWLGPAIGPTRFEVGQDVFDCFTRQHTDSASCFTEKSAGKWFADLYSLARNQLKTQGVHAIFGGDFCTYSQDDLFFSYRRDGAATGRMATLIWLSQSQ